MKVFKAKVLSIKQDVPDVYVIKLKRPKGFDFKAGQFIFVKRVVNGVPAIRAYSISSSPNEKNYFELCVKKVPGGKVSPYLCSLKKGQILEFKGPAGKFTLDSIPQKTLVFAATGTGISAIKSLITYILEKGFKKDIYLFFGVRTHKNIIYKKELENLAKKYKNLHFIPVLSREHWNGEEGHVQEPIKKYAKKLNTKESHMFVCGVPIMVEETKELALNLGFHEKNMHYERC